MGSGKFLVKAQLSAIEDDKVRKGSSGIYAQQHTLLPEKAHATCTRNILLLFPFKAKILDAGYTRILVIDDFHTALE